MAKRGAPFGNKNGVADKPWTNALERALAQYSDGNLKAGQALRGIADGVVKRALAGDAIACKEIAERLDGKPVQAIAATVDTNITVEVIRFGSRPASE